VNVEAKQVDGDDDSDVPDIVRETTDWLQNYFSNGLAGNLPTICVLSNSKHGKQLFALTVACWYTVFNLVTLSLEWDLSFRVTTQNVGKPPQYCNLVKH